MRQWLALVVVAAACGGRDIGDDAGSDAWFDGDRTQVDAVSSSDGGTAYHDMSVSSYWSTFDAAALCSQCTGFAGGTFDGRYVYLAPESGGVVARYDTTATFTTTNSWSTFDTHALKLPSSFLGATFDGRYVYFAPLYGGVVARYDSNASFTTTTSWSTFDMGNVSPNVLGYQGATFDGRYIYFAPDSTTTPDAGVLGGVVRYDTTASFAQAGSWSVFNPSTTMSGFAGAVFDGHAIYLVPNPSATVDDGVVTRYDTTSSFSDTTSWSAFDATTLKSSATFFWGAAFDGRFVYLVPSSTYGTVPRYDTTLNIDAGTAWSMFDMTPVLTTPEQFWGAAFDGRFIYFVPSDAGPSGHFIVRYDTTASFSANTSWTTFDPTTVNAGAKGFNGAVFDGHYVYFVPHDNGSTVVRFDAKAPTSMPALLAWHGSFF